MSKFGVLNLLLTGSTHKFTCIFLRERIISDLPLMLLALIVMNLDFLRYGVRTPQPIRNDNLDLRLANFHSSSSLALG
jgi:hypothetical protein